MAADYWLVKRGHVDIPGLYDPRGRYRYKGGCNWRAAAAFLIPVAPLLPGLGQSITPESVHIGSGLSNLYSFNWLFGFVCSIVLYTALSYAFPAKDTLLDETVWDLMPPAILAQPTESDVERGVKSTERMEKMDDPFSKTL